MRTYFIYKKIEPKKMDLLKFSKVIYDNFIELARIEYVRHTRRNILQLLQSDNFHGYAIYHNNVCIAYIIGELNFNFNGRNSFYISYLYVIPVYRKKGLGSDLLNMARNYCKNTGINFIILTADTSNKKLVKFYRDRGFLIDKLSRGRKHEIFCLFI